MKTLLKNAKIFGGETADILVEDGKIIGIGSYDTADQVRDMSGYAAVLPGVIDAHMHIVTGPIEYNDVALKNWAQAGVTTVRDLGIGNDRNEHPTEEFLAYRETIENPECAHCQTCGRFVTQFHGYSHIMSDGAETGIGCKTPEECTQAVDSLIDIGCDGIKTAVDRGSAMFGGEKPLLSVEQLRAIAQAAQRRGVWCCAHVLEADLVPMLLDAGIPELCHMPTDRVPDEVLQRMVDQGVTCVPTLCTINAPRPPLPKDAKMPPMPKMPKGMTPPPPVDTKEQEKICVDNVRRFVEKGGMVAVGTDTMRMESQPHVATMPVRELQLLHEAGLSVAQVVDAATINAAKVLKIDDQVGSIAVGKQANIIAVKDEIDETFQALSHVEFVMNRGTIIKE
jgi:imidazolonepropionase-like amidohydrolase